MKVLSVLAAFLLVASLPVAVAQQISPNPNIAGNTIILKGEGWYHDGQDRFVNDGILNLERFAEMENKARRHLQNNDGGVVDVDAAARLKNIGTFSNEKGGAVAVTGTFGNRGGLFRNIGNLKNTGAFHNNGTIYNSSHIDSSGRIANAGRFENGANTLAFTFENVAGGSVLKRESGRFTGLSHINGEDSEFTNDGHF